MQTKQKVTIAFAVWFTLGIALFTAHGQYTIVDSLYIMAQIITTVGYGDLVADTNCGYAFIACYALVSVVMIAGAASAVLDSLIEEQQEVVRKQLDALSHSHVLDHLPTLASSRALTGQAPQERSDPTLWRFIRALGIWLFFVVTWIIFFAVKDGEEKTVLQALYMGIITLTTIGFGDIVPKTEWGKAFATVWMLLGVSALANAVAKFSAYFLPDEKQYGLRKLTKNTLRRMFQDEHVQLNHEDREMMLINGHINEGGERVVSRSDYVVFILKEMGFVDKAVIDKIYENFDLLDADGNRCLNEQDIEAHHQQQQKGQGYEPPELPATSC